MTVLRTTKMLTAGTTTGPKAIPRYTQTVAVDAALAAKKLFSLNVAFQPDVLIQVTKNGTLQTAGTDYSIDQSGMVTWLTTLTNGDTVVIFQDELTPTGDDQEEGIFVFRLSAGSPNSCTIQCKGRAFAGGNYFIITQKTQADVQTGGQVPGGEGVLAVLVKLFPHMQVEVTAIATSTSVDAWIIE